MSNRIQSAIRAAAEMGVGLLAACNRLRLPGTRNPFVVGVHEPMREELTLENLPVTGVIPPGLDGLYLKMGANPVRPAMRGHDWFLGDGMVHGLAIEGGRALWYRNRWIASRTAAAALKRPAAPGPRRGGNDTVNTNVVEIGGRIFAVVEAGSFPVELSRTLEEQRYNPLEGTLAGSFTGHPHRDPLTGETHAIAYDGRIWDRVRHVVVAPTGQVVRDMPIAVEHGPCVHDCAITARFVIVLDLPVTFSLKAVLAGYRFPFRWNTDHKARVGLLPRQGASADILWCEVASCFVFHVANAYDDADGRVILDVIAYETVFASAEGGLDTPGKLERWTLDAATRRVERRVLDSAAQEFPRIDERLFGQHHRYLYTVSVPEDGNTQLAGATQIYKHDLETGERQVHAFGADRIPGEFVFVPARPGAGEDEGWLVGLVIDTAHHTTDFVILDARSFAEPPIARIRLGHRIPPGFHGNWFPTQGAGDTGAHNAPGDGPDGASRRSAVAPAIGPAIPPGV
ncbi:8'-apo-carotenoid 13,14-cleaving dioxygenase [Methylorubrum suomiense]|uniref:Dioxygenase n=1 Tax=Methylorubrum suomiense TaxID=144191 RepID=A0ABQ4UXU0_9HYPH|nr:MULTISPECIES: carotenoid oxygenase family protein [Methylobacteriaceae]GJE75532.1 8'-apo-carotenoid 13,14-cleaving dioxygenase [Methylorubrum suomiense]